jgi:sugar/nucleoside kinase (ribokinase family)
MTARFDVLGLGCVAVDDLLYVAAYPPADAKVQVRRRERQGGGLTATALVAAARLGSACAYAATLGHDELSAWVAQRLAAEGIDLTHLRRVAGARPIHSTIIVDESRLTRTIFYDLEGVEGARPDWPAKEVIHSARVLFVDHFGVEGMTRAARVARAAGVTVVADFERDDPPGFPELLALVDHLILSRAFAGQLTGAADPAAAVRKLWAAGRQAVVVTCGEEGAVYLGADRPDTPRHQPAFEVRAVDTTGCGDVFHGAYASALARSLDLAGRVRFASAAAALKATRRGGQAGAPTRGAVETFLQEHAS